MRAITPVTILWVKDIFNYEPIISARYTVIPSVLNYSGYIVKTIQTTTWRYLLIADVVLIYSSCNNISYRWNDCLQNYLFKPISQHVMYNNLPITMYVQLLLNAQY